MLSFGEIKDLVVDTFNDWNEDKAPRLAAALAYYTIFSLAPLLIIVIAIAGLVFGQEAARGQIFGQIDQFVGEEGASAIQDMLAASDKPQSGIFAVIIGIVTLLFGAAGVFGQLQDALNTIWEVAPKPGRGIWGFIKDRFLSFGMVLGIGFLLLVSLIISAVLAGIGSAIGGEAYGQSIIWSIINLLVSAAVTTGLFAMIFKLLPDAKVAWSDVWLGAGITTVLFLVGRFAISQYLARAATGSTFGAAGSLVSILIWIFFSAQILFLGAEFTQVYARRYGSKIEPADDAVAVTEEDRAQQGMPSSERVAAAAKSDNKRPPSAASGSSSTKRERGRSVGTASQQGSATANVPNNTVVKATKAGILGVILARIFRQRTQR